MTIDDYLKKADPLIKNIAVKAVHYKEELTTGQISQAEYDGLTAQLLDLDIIYKNADAADIKQEIAEAIQVIALFLGKV